MAWDMFVIQAPGRTLQGPYYSKQQARCAIARLGLQNAKVKALIPPDVESDFLDNDRLHREHPGHEDP